MTTNSNSLMQQCPLCEGENKSQMALEANADDSAPCWCVAEHFPSATLETLEQLTGPARCVCQNCLKQDQGELNAG